MSHYTKALDQPGEGLRVAVLKEGFSWPQGHPAVDTKVAAAAQHLAKLGMSVDEVSIDLHRRAWHVWFAFAFEGYFRNMVLGAGMGFSHGGLFVTSLVDKLRNWRKHSNEFPPGLKMGMLGGQYVSESYGSHYYAKAINIARRLRDAYDTVLAQWGCPGRC